MERLQAFKFERQPNGEQQRNMRRFAGRHGRSFRYPDPKQIKLDQANSRIFLPKLGWLRYRASQNVLGEVRNVTVSQSGGKWFVSIQTHREVEATQPSGGIVGIDMGIARFVTLSDGSYLAPLNSFKKHQQRLRKYQRRMARKVKFSHNWKAKVTQIHIDIGHARKDSLHKASHAISQNHAIVCIEDLQVRNMSQSSKGNAEQHGKQVKQKSGLNRAILDQGWGEFRRQLDYKLAWRGGHLIATPAGRIRRVGWWRQRTAVPKPSLSVSNVATKTTPMWSGPSMF